MIDDRINRSSHDPGRGGRGEGENKSLISGLERHRDMSYLWSWRIERLRSGMHRGFSSFCHVNKHCWRLLGQKACARILTIMEICLPERGGGCMFTAA